MKEFVEATQEEDLCLTELSLKVIGGQTWKRKHKNMSRNAINAKDSPQTYTNKEESLIPYPALGHLPNGAGYYRPFPQSNREQKVFIGRHRLFHQMG